MRPLNSTLSSALDTTICLVRFALAGAVLLATGCPASSDDVKPPPDELYFPTGLAIDSDNADLFVVNANSDLRFDSGVVTVLSVDRIVEAVEAWDNGDISPPATECAADQGFPETLICNERTFIDADRSIRIGNFATEIAIQILASGAERLFVAVRGDPSLTYIDIAQAGAPLSCGGEGIFHECADTHRLTAIRDDDDLPSIPDEPFGVYVDSGNEFAMTTHLSNGAISLANAPADGSVPQLTDAVGGIFQPGPNSAPGAVGVAGRLPGSPNDRVYVTSRTDPRVQTVLVARIPGQPAQLVAGEFFTLDTVLPSSDSRDIAFSADGEKAYIINRDPPSLQIIDTSLSDTGIPRNEPDGVIELCRQASNIELVQTPFGVRLYIACFQDGEVWVVDPRIRRVESIILTGRGPQFLAASTRGLVFVSNFRENTIAVIDARIGSATENRVVLRIGRPNETEGVE